MKLVRLFWVRYTVAALVRGVGSSSRVSYEVRFDVEFISMFLSRAAYQGRGSNQKSYTNAKPQTPGKDSLR